MKTIKQGSNIYLNFLEIFACSMTNYLINIWYIALTSVAIATELSLYDLFTKIIVFSSVVLVCLSPLLSASLP
jgi:hypothetical protein